MAPKQKAAAKKKKVQGVASVVKTKTKVVQETVQVTTAELDSEPPVSCSTVQVEVEVDGPDAKKKTAADQQKETPPVVPLQSQETQDPNEEEEEKKKKTSTSTSVAAAEKEKRAGGRKGGGGGGGGRNKKRRRGGVEYGGYKRYVWRVLKQVHPDMGASGSTMEVLDMMMADMFERLAEEASRLSKVSGRATLTSREVQSAVRLVLPGDLANHAISEGTKAISNYLS